MWGQPAATTWSRVTRRTRWAAGWACARLLGGTFWRRRAGCDSSVCRLRLRTVARVCVAYTPLARRTTVSGSGFVQGAGTGVCVVCTPYKAVQSNAQWQMEEKSSHILAVCKVYGVCVPHDKPSLSSTVRYAVHAACRKNCGSFFSK